VKEPHCGNEFRDALPRISHSLTCTTTRLIHESQPKPVLIYRPRGDWPTAYEFCCVFQQDIPVYRSFDDTTNSIYMYSFNISLDIIRIVVLTSRITSIASDQSNLAKAASKTLGVGTQSNTVWHECALGLEESPPQTVLRSVLPFLGSSGAWHKLTD